MGLCAKKILHTRKKSFCSLFFLIFARDRKTLFKLIKVMLATFYNLENFLSANVGTVPNSTNGATFLRKNSTR